MRLKDFIFISCLLVLSVQGLQAQEAITSSGGNKTGSGGSVSYSLGQVVYTTNNGSSGSVIQGVQIPYEITVLSDFKENLDIRLSISAYPNPATDYLLIAVGEFNTSDLYYQLFDMKGKLLKFEKIEDRETKITIANLVPGSYILKIFENNQPIKTFKIIKH